VSKYHNDASFASDPVKIRLSTKRFRRLEPSAGGFRGWWWRQFSQGTQFEELLDEHMSFGDSRAACVVSLEPLLVAAYTDELDCVAMLRFPEWLIAEHRLEMESRLLTVNTYGQGRRVVIDLMPGPKDLHNYNNYFPVIAEFVSDERRLIDNRKANISEDEWQRCLEMGFDYLRRFPGQWRNGSPLYSANPAL